MRSLPLLSIPTRAADCNDRPSTVNRSSSGVVDSYGCESGHLRPIVAVGGRQNENKALRTKEIGQNQKKIRERPSVGTTLGTAFPGVYWGNGPLRLCGCAFKVSASGLKSAEMAQAQLRRTRTERIGSRRPRMLAARCWPARGVERPWGCPSENHVSETNGWSVRAVGETDLALRTSEKSRRP
jgi:hypothetical protein